MLNLGGVYDAGAVARDGSILNASLHAQMISKKDVLKAVEVVAQTQSHLTVQTHAVHGQETITTSNVESPQQLVVFPFDTSMNQMGDLPIVRTLKW